MAKLEIKYRTEGKALPPRPIRVTGWMGDQAARKENGSHPQPWHCPLFVEGCTNGVELLYQYETECHVVNNNGDVRIHWDAANEPGGGADPGEFTLGAPLPAKNYLFTSSIDIQAPPGYVLRVQPHPRFFTDETGTVPVALYGHVHSEWWPKKVFLVFKSPTPGKRHIFRKGEPYAQITFVPEDTYDLRRMTPEEDARRKRLQDDIRKTKSLIAKHVWHSAEGIEFNDHYKVLERAFERDGVPGVEEVVRAALERYATTVPAGLSVPEYFDLARRYHAEGRITEAKEVLHHIRALDPNNADVNSRMAMLEWDVGLRDEAVRTMRRAVAMQPRVPVHLKNLGEMLRRTGKAAEAEACLAAALRLTPEDPELASQYGLAVAQNGRAEEGVELCRKAVAASPSAPALHVRQGLALTLLGRSQEARACYEAALTLDPKHGPARQAMQALERKPATGS